MTTNTVFRELGERSWSVFAACYGRTEEMFPTPMGKGNYNTAIGPYRAAIARAKAICASCAVFDACRDWGDVEEGSRTAIYGIVAGEAPRERITRRFPEKIYRRLPR